MKGYTKALGVSLGILLGAAGCGGGSSSSARVPKPTNVVVTPGSISLRPGESIQFRATVLGEEGVSQQVKWSFGPADVPGSALGTLRADGTYTAPAVVSASTVLVNARSAADTSVQGTGIVDLPERSIRVTPASVELAVDSSVRFTAAVTGMVNQQVTWETDAPGSPIDAEGVFTVGLSHAGGHFRVTAIDAAGDRADARVDVSPFVLSGTSGPAAPGETITVHGSGFGELRLVKLAFSAETGEQVFAEGTVTADGATVVVPVGAASGAVRTVLPPSNAVPFERAPALRLRPAAQELAAGQPTELQLAFLGAPPVPVTLETDLGQIDGSTYRAPASVAEPSFATVRACQSGTVRCAVATIALHPFTVAPEPPLVRAGEAVQLQAGDGAGPISATFALRAGGGTCTTDGRYVSPSSPAGPARIEVDAAPGRALVEVGVEGSTPGLLARMMDHVDHRPDVAPGTPRSGSWAEAVAVDGTRAYVAAGPPQATFCIRPDCPYPLPDGSPGTWWIDVYDLADRSRPRWLGAVESATRPQQLLVAGGRLVAFSGKDSTASSIDPAYGGHLLPDVPSSAVYDITRPLPALLTRQVTTRSSSPIEPSLLGTTLVRYEYLDNSSRNGFRVLFSGLTAARPLEVTREATAPVPWNCQVQPQAVTDGKRLYGVFSCEVDGVQVWHRGTWDLSVEPAQLVDDQVARWYDPPQPTSVHGSLLLERDWRLGWTRVYDLSSGIPRLLSTVPTGSAIRPLEGPDGKFLLGGGHWPGGRRSGIGLTMVDLSAPASPQPLSTTSTGSHARASAALLGGTTALVAEGLAGVGIYDLGPPGGSLPTGSLEHRPGTGICSLLATGAFLRGGRIYAGGYGGCGDEVFPFLGSWEVAGAGRPLVGLEPRWWAVLPWLTDTAALAEWSGGFVFGSGGAVDVFSLADPDEPVTTTTLPIDARAVAVDGAIAWVGTWAGDLVAVDLEAPSGPRVVGTLAVGPMPVAIRPLGGGVLAIGLARDGTGDLVLVDGSVPSAATELGRAQLNLAVNGLDVDGSIAALATDAGLVVVDLTDLGHPEPLAWEPLPQADPFGEVHRTPVGLAARFVKGIAWIGTSDHGDDLNTTGSIVRGYDLANPAWPDLVASIHVPDDPYGSDVLLPVDEELFVAGTGFRLFDIRHPRNVIRNLAEHRELLR